MPEYVECDACGWDVPASQALFPCPHCGGTVWNGPSGKVFAVVRAGAPRRYVCARCGEKGDPSRVDASKPCPRCGCVVWKGQW